MCCRSHERSSSKRLASFPPSTPAALLVGVCAGQQQRKTTGIASRYQAPALSGFPECAEFESNKEGRPNAISSASEATILRTKRYILPVIVLLLAGCSGAMTTYEAQRAGHPMPMFYKSGVNFQQIVSDNTDCQVDAVQRVPAQIHTTTSPEYSTPGSAICNQIGTQTFCNQVGGQTYGGETQSYDVNANLRQQVHFQCMAKKGYQYVNIPACAASVDLSDQINETVLRPLSSRTCYQGIKSGGFMIGDY